MPYTPMSARKQHDGFGRIQLDDDAPDTDIADITNPANLSSSVGESGQNNRRDVAKVETMLGQAGALDLKQTDGPTGYWGTRTADATKKVQADHGLKVDAEINPNGPTIKKLGQITNSHNATKRRKEYRESNPHQKYLRRHFEEREARNKPLPNSIRRADRSGFEMYPQWQNAEHQNDVGEPEVKYVHPDGREVIFDGDTGKVATDPQIKGTFNYVNPPRFDPKNFDLEGWGQFLGKGVEHVIKDVLPYWMHGNSRKR